MKKPKKLLAVALMMVFLGSLAGCIVADGPYPGGPYRYRDPRWRYDRYERYDRYRDHRHGDYRHRDWDRDRD